MEVYRHENPPALLIIEERRLEVIDLATWRMIPIEGAFASEYLDCLNGSDSASKPLIRAVRDLNNRFHNILFTLLEKGRGHRYEPESLYPARPWQLWLEMTNQCNAHCIHCYAESSPQQDTYMDRNLAFRLLHEAADMGFQIVQFTGGDPLLHPDLVGLVTLATRLGFKKREVFTNGLLLDASLLDQLLDAGACFAISFYSHNPEHHERITRVPASHQRTVKAIKSLVEEKAQLRIAVILMQENSEDLKQTYEFLETLGLDRTQIRYDFIHPAGRGANVALPHPRRDNACPDDKSTTFYPGERDTHFDSENGRKGNGKVAVSPVGMAFPCIFQRWLPLGNLHKESLQAIYQRPPGSGNMAPEHAFKECCEKLACRDCRITAYLSSRMSAPSTPDRYPRIA